MQLKIKIFRGDYRRVVGSRLVSPSRDGAGLQDTQALRPSGLTSGIQDATELSVRWASDLELRARILEALPKPFKRPCHQTQTVGAFLSM